MVGKTALGKEEREKGFGGPSVGIQKNWSGKILTGLNRKRRNCVAPISNWEAAISRISS